jgi:multisubunit Na+/H+ antiporter MnhF subunit
MFGVLGGTCERINRRKFLACLALSAASISAAIWWLLPAVNCYRGLSGIDSALFTLVAVNMLRQARRDRDLVLAAILALGLLGFIAKLAYEIATGTTLFVNSSAAGFVPLPLVHAVGGSIGAVIGSRSASAAHLFFARQ